MEKIAEVIRLHFKLDLSVRQTSSALNIARSSVGDYCQKFKSLNLDFDCKNRSKPDTNVGVRPDAKTEFNRTVKRS